jgi:hypothetical protein
MFMLVRRGDAKIGQGARLAATQQQRHEKTGVW